MGCSVVVGGFFGDEGKGKIISYLALKDKPAIIARGGVGPNAGHTVCYKQKTYKLRQVPSGFVYEDAYLLIGPGVLIDPDVLLKEIEETKVSERIGIDYNCGIIESFHKSKDRKGYLAKKIGTTGSGCGPANVDRVSRKLKIAKEISYLEKYLVDVPLEVNKAIDEGKLVLVEGTQGTFLSLYHGTYPYVTSKDITASTICSDVGIGPKRVDDVIVVFKSYVTRVGGGPLRNELSREEAEKRGWFERATVTGRVRRAAPFDFELAKRAIMLNSATQIALTKLDILFPECRDMKEYDELPKKAKGFVEEIERKLKIPVTLIGVGPCVEEVIDRR